MKTRLQLHLPANVAIEFFGDAILFVGTTLDALSFREIISQIPEPHRYQVIGWKRVRQLPKAIEPLAV